MLTQEGPPSGANGDLISLGCTFSMWTLLQICTNVITVGNGVGRRGASPVWSLGGERNIISILKVLSIKMSV